MSDAGECAVPPAAGEFTIGVFGAWLTTALKPVVQFQPLPVIVLAGVPPVLSATVWLVLGVYVIESRFLPLPGVRRVFALLGAAVVLLSLAFPGDIRAPAASPWAPLHWLLGVAKPEYEVAPKEEVSIKRESSEQKPAKPPR